jgi:phosphonate transport system ATP-binding protein
VTAPAVHLRQAGLHLAGRDVLAGLDLTVEPGERVAVIGPSGAGKSSLLSLLNGTASPTSGEVRVLGEDLGRLGARARRSVQRRIGTVHQNLLLTPSLKVVHNVSAGLLGEWSLPGAAWSLLAPRETKGVHDALAVLGLEDRLRARTGDLSGGEQQRVAIARALVQSPDLLLADEPIASLDPVRAQRVVDVLLDLNERYGTTLLVGLHDVDVALRRFDRVLGLRAGRLAFDLPAAEVGAGLCEDLFAGAETVAVPAGP